MAKKKPVKKQPGGPTEFTLTRDLMLAIAVKLADGSTNKDACQLSGIGESTFYYWLATGRAVKYGTPLPAKAPSKPEDRALCVEFLDSVTRAEATARQAAIAAVMESIRGAQTVETFQDTFTETRLNSKGEPYEYKRVTKGRKITKHAKDPKTAIEYLKRRDKAHWAERVESMNIDFEASIIQAIRAGEVDYESLLDEFKDKALVDGWFNKAGVSPTQESESGNATDE